MTQGVNTVWQFNPNPNPKVLASFFSTASQVDWFWRPITRSWSWECWRISLRTSVFCRWSCIGHKIFHKKLGCADTIISENWEGALHFSTLQYRYRVLNKAIAHDRMTVILFPQMLLVEPHFLASSSSMVTNLTKVSKKKRIHNWYQRRSMGRYFPGKGRVLNPYTGIGAGVKRGNGRVSMHCCRVEGRWPRFCQRHPQAAGQTGTTGQNAADSVTFPHTHCWLHSHFRVWLCADLLRHHIRHGSQVLGRANGGGREWCRLLHRKLQSQIQRSSSRLLAFLELHWASAARLEIGNIIAHHIVSFSSFQF